MRIIENNYKYDLAKDYEISSDLKTYTVTIRDDVNFTDGSQLTAEDVAFSYNKAKELGEGSFLFKMWSFSDDCMYSSYVDSNYLCIT